MIGENVVKYPKVVSREAEEGHIIGNHTYSHVDLTKMSQEMTECELGKTNTAIEEITGKKDGIYATALWSLEEGDGREYRHDCGAMHCGSA